MARRYGERRVAKCRFLSPDPLSFLSGLLNSRAEFPLRPGFLTGTSAVRYFTAPRPSHRLKRGLYFPHIPVFSRAQARPVFPQQPGFLAGSSAACISPATRLSHGNKRGQYFLPQPGFLTGTSAVSAASACERTALRFAKQQGAIATQSNGVERSPSGD